MIKKIITFTLFLILISINKNVFAAPDENCPIEKKTPDFLREYIKNVRTVEKNMLENLSTLKVKDFKWKLVDIEDYRWNLRINPINQKDLDKVVPFIRTEYFKISNRVSYLFNEATNWNSFSAETIYFTALAMFQEIPPAITRDFSLIRNESKKIDRRLKYLVRRWYYNWLVDSKQLCDWVTEESLCDFSGVESIWEAYTLLKTNNNKIEDAIMLSLYWNLDTVYSSMHSNIVWERLFLIKPDFLDNVSKFYWKSTFTDCSINWDVWSWYKEWLEKIKDATNNAKISEDAVKDWKEAMALAKWMPNEQAKYQEEERKILARELARNWLPTNAARAIMDNLERTNRWWWFWSMENNPISHTIKYTKENVRREWAKFNKFWESITRENWPVIDPNNFWKKNKRLSYSMELDKDIARLYEKAEPFAQMSIEQDEKIKSKFRVAFLNLISVIENLSEVEDMACKVCEAQMQNITNDFCCPKQTKVK